MSINSSPILQLPLILPSSSFPGGGGLNSADLGLCAVSGIFMVLEAKLLQGSGDLGYGGGSA